MRSASAARSSRPSASAGSARPSPQPLRRPHTPGAPRPPPPPPAAHPSTAPSPCGAGPSSRTPLAWAPWRAHAAGPRLLLLPPWHHQRTPHRGQDCPTAPSPLLCPRRATCPPRTTASCPGLSAPRGTARRRLQPLQWPRLWRPAPPLGWAPPGEAQGPAGAAGARGWRRGSSEQPSHTAASGPVLEEASRAPTVGPTSHQRRHLQATPTVPAHPWCAPEDLPCHHCEARPLTLVTQRAARTPGLAQGVAQRGLRRTGEP